MSEPATWQAWQRERKDRWAAVADALRADETLIDVEEVLRLVSDYGSAAFTEGAWFVRGQGTTVAVPLGDVLEALAAGVDAELVIETADPRRLVVSVARVRGAR